MKKIIIIALTSVTLFACSTNQNQTTSNTDDAGMTEFKINSKIVLDLFDAFSKNDSNTYNTNFSDTVKIHGAAYGREAIVGKAVELKFLQGMHTILTNIKANDIKLLPGVDEVTFKPDGGVRVYVRWTDDAIANGAKIEHKFYAVYQFNKDHKVVDVDEYMDFTGLMNAVTAPKK